MVGQKKKIEQTVVQRPPVEQAMLTEVTLVAGSRMSYNDVIYHKGDVFKVSPAEAKRLVAFGCCDFQKE